MHRMSHAALFAGIGAAPVHWHSDFEAVHHLGATGGAAAAGLLFPIAVQVLRSAADSPLPRQRSTFQSGSGGEAQQSDV